jgi:hypothetical protein
MSNLDDIFDLPGGGQQAEQPEKKQRKKVEMSDEKKSAMLERLAKGREKRAENLKAKKEPKEPKETKEQKEEIVIKKETVSNSKDANKEVINKKQNKVQKETEDERLSFIKMMAGKSKPVEKVERPKKKVYKEELPFNIAKPDEVKKIDRKDQEKPVKVIAPSPVVPANLAIVREPVIIRTFKKPIWA